MPKETAKQSKSKVAAKPVPKKPAATKAPAKTAAAKAAPAKAQAAKAKPAPAPAKPAPAKPAAKAAAKAQATKPAPAPVKAAPVVQPEPQPAPKAPEPKAKRGKDKHAMPAAAPAQPLDLETKRTRLKNLIALGKERGFLTYAEINDHLPDDLVDAEQIESIISTFNDMGIQVFDEAPAAEEMLLNEAGPAAVDEAEVEEETEQALSTVESEFGRTTDPVRMYMREMGSVELLTREGEIEIAKRIEDGLKHMIMAISACPMTVGQILELADKIAKDELKIDD
ncbi:partial RNA polymerase sigma factor RpoD, partial [Rhodocyclaceae bacterium]